MSKISKVIGERIRIYRNKANLSQEDLAETAGLHNTYIGQVERGEKNATLESIAKITNALDVSFEELFRNINGNTQKESTPLICYDLILKLSKNEQDNIYEIIKRIINFRD